MCSSDLNGLIGGITDPLFYVKRQAVFVVIGLGVMAAAILIDYRRMREWAPVIYGLTVLMLMAVLTPLGASTNGSQARFSLGPFALQPSEFAKFSVTLMVAAYCAQHRGDLDVRRLLVVLAIAAPPLGLVMLQPDLGTALVIGAIILAVLAVAGVRARHLAVLALLGVTGAVVAVNVGEPASTVSAFLKKNVISLPVWLDTTSEVSAAYGASSIPTLVVIDRAGKVVAYKIGVREESDLRE